MTYAKERVRTLYPRLIEGDMGVVADFSERATADTPLMGKQLPAEFVSDGHAWLERHRATARDVRTTVTPARVIHEIVLLVAVGEQTRELPVMLVADVEADLIRDLRVYHSTWPLTRSHLVRRPLMQYTHEAPLPIPIAAYHAALVAGDAAAADACFEPEGSVREPAGSDFEWSGAERTDWYRTTLSRGPLVLHLGTVSDDGSTVVFEYEVDHWGDAAIPSQAGAAAYTRGATGRIASARIYDDIEPPDLLGAE